MTPNLQASIVWGSIDSDGGANPWISSGALNAGPPSPTPGDASEVRRRERRYLVDQPAQLASRRGGVWTVQIRDISPRGMQLMVQEAIAASAEVLIRWNGRQVSGTIRYNHKYDASWYRIGVELDGRADELMREVLARQSEELRDSNLTLQQQAVLASQYGALLHLTSDAIAVFSPEGVVFFWNAAAERLYGWSREDVIGTNIRSFLQFDPPRAAPGLESGVSAPAAQSVRQVRKNGTTVSVAARWFVQHDSAGQTQAIVCLSRETPASESR